MKTGRRDLRPGKTWPPGPSSFTGMIPIQEDFTGMRPFQENSSSPFIIRTENQEGSSVCSFFFFFFASIYFTRMARYGAGHHN